MEEYPAVGKTDLAEDVEVRSKGLAEGGLGEVGVKSTATPDQLLEHWVLRGNPFEDEVPGGEAGAEGHVGEGDLALEQKMMQDGEHHHGVEVPRGAAEE